MQKNATVGTPIVNGQIFIIPNSSICWGDEVRSEPGMWSDLYDTYLANYDVCKEMPFKDTRFFEMWFNTKGNDDSNWVCHGIDGYDELEGFRVRSAYLPETLFKGKKEGDTITIWIVAEDWDRTDKSLLTKRIKVSLTLKQRGYRYDRFGNFEEVLERVR